jgi:hypothetical protein
LNKECIQKSNLGFITNPKNGRVKALSKACLDRTYLRFITNPKNGRVKALSKACLDRTYYLKMRGHYEKKF